MIEIEHIGKFVKQKLEGYKATPSPGTWDAIQQKIPASSPGIPKWKWWVYSSGVAVIAAFTYFLVTSTAEQDTKPGNDQKENVPVTVEEDTSENRNTQASENETIEITEQETSSARGREPNVSEKDKSVARSEPRKEAVQMDNLESLDPGLDTNIPSIDNQSIIKEKNRDSYLQLSERDKATDTRTRIDPEKARPVTFSADKEACAGHKITLWASGGRRYRWMNGNTDSSITILPAKYENYSVTVTNNLGQEIVHDFEVDVKECGKVFVPNAFTPDGDGRNDVFKAYGVSIEEFHMEIMNRKGNIIFESENINEGWDGNYNDGPARAGVYVYRIVYTGIEGETKTKSGTFTLIR